MHSMDSMKKTILVFLSSLFAVMLFATAAVAQDDDFDDLDDDDDDGVAMTQPLPDTGGPLLAVPVAGALLVGAGAAGLLRLRSRKD